MTSVVYPDTLPGPEKWVVKGIDRRASSSLREPSNSSRARSRDKNGVASVSWMYTSAQMDVWKAWFKDTLVSGQKWFGVVTPGPTPNSRVARYVLATLRRQNLGNGVFLVSCDVEIRGLSETPSAGGYQAQIMADLPLVWWKCDDSSLSNIGVDSGVLGLPLAILDGSICGFGGATLCDGSGSLDFIGSGYNATRAEHNDALNFPAHALTLSALVQPRSLNRDMMILGHGTTNLGYNNWGLKIDSGGHLVMHLADDNSREAQQTFTSPTVLSLGTRYRVAARWDEAGVVSIFQDRDLVLTGAFSPALWASTSVIGVGCSPHVSGLDPGSGAFDGLLDEVAIWDRALSDERLNAHFDSL